MSTFEEREALQTRIDPYDSPPDDGLMHVRTRQTQKKAWKALCDWHARGIPVSNFGEARWIAGVRWLLQRVDGGVFLKFSDTYKRRTMEFVR